MKRLVSSMSGGQKGFTLIELLVVIAILGVIAAVVALNVGTFFGRGTVQAANTELHQVQTSIISAMADAETGTLSYPPLNPDGTVTYAWWSGGSVSTPTAQKAGANYTAADYVYGPLRATYLIDSRGTIHWAICADDTRFVPPTGYSGSVENLPVDGWSGIRWNNDAKNWHAGDESVA